MGPQGRPQRKSSRELPSGPDTAAEARWFVADALRDWDQPVDLDTAALLTSEVATNAARHGKEPIELSIELEGQGLRVSAFDRGPGFDPKDQAVRGRGLGVSLLDTLSAEWGVEPREDGTEVWFRI
jgi:anti-sigma regulatory factor (Ser/Thr protein kinase)